jgi:predicted DNA-binding protein (MmcQ/YjbR family)
MEVAMVSKPKASRAKSRKSTARRKTPARAKPGPPKRTSKPKKGPGPFGIRTAPKGDRFYAPEMAIRKYALGMPEATEDYPWGHRAFRVGKKVFLFLAWDDGVFSVTAKLPDSQAMALTLPFAELTGYGMGRSGWVTARFSGREKVPVPLLYQWIEESYGTIAPKKLAARRVKA